MQTTLLGFAIALILALLAALVGPYFVNWNDHRAFFESEASRLVGLTVRVGGDIDAAILPTPSVTLRDIAIGPAGEASRFRARSLRIELGLGPLLRGKIRAVEMRLVAPQFSVGLDGDGRLDWPPLAIATETLSIDRLSIEDGRATLSDAASRSQQVLDQLWFSGEVRSLTGPFRGKGEFVAGGRLYGYEVSAGRNGPDGIRVRLTLKNDERPLSIQADGMLAFERAAPRFDGTLTLSRPAGAVLASGKAVAYEPWRLTGKVKTEAAAAKFQELSFQYGPDERAVTLAGAAEFAFGARPHLQVELSARQADLDRLLATPEMPRRPPLSAVRALGEMLGNALRPSWPVQLSLGIDTATLSGATLQSIVCELRSDGATWALANLELRAPGFTQIKAHGRLYPAATGLGFAGGVSVNANDPRNLVAWLAGGTATVAQIKPWHATGDVTLAADRIAVERLRTEFDSGKLEGRLAYSWPAGDRPARLEGDLRAAALDLDAALGLGRSALAGLKLDWPRELKLALDVGRTRIAGFEAGASTARISLDAGALAIERLSIADLGGASLEASGRIRTQGSPDGSLALDLDARDVGGVIALAQTYLPSLAEPLRRLTRQQKTAMLRAAVSVGGGGTDRTSGRIGLSGQVGAVRVHVSASATGKSEVFSLTNPAAFADAELRLDGRFESDQAGAVLALLGLERIAAANPRPAQLNLSAIRAPRGDLRFEGELDAGPLDVSGKGAIRLADNQPAVLELDQFAGAIAGNKVQGRLVLRLDEPARIDGTIEAETLDAPATVAAAVGMPVQPDGAAEWSSEPFAWGAGALTGRIEFKAERAALSPALVAQGLRGVARFGASEVVFEDVAGEIANGSLEGRLAVANGADGLSARINLGVTNADAARIFANADGAAVSGRLSLRTELEGSGRSPAAFVGSLSGFGTVTLERAQFAGLNPGVFDAVSRAIELGIPVEGNRIRAFVSGVLDNAGLPVSRATASVNVNAGRARFGDIAIQSEGAELQATASLDLADASLDALLTLRGGPAAPDAPRPAVLVALKGPLLAPQRVIDAGRLTSWLTLRAVEQRSKQLDAIERSGLAPPPSQEPAEAGPARPPAAPLSIRKESQPERAPDTTGGLPAARRAPPLPPPVDILAPGKPQTTTPPPGLVGAQN